MKRWLIPVVVVVVVAAGVGGYFAGKATGGTTTVATNAAGMPGFQGGYGGNGGVRGGNGNMTSGSVVSKDENTMTIKLSDGNTKMVVYSASTAVSQTKDMSVSALAVGDQVTVSGTTNADGSLTAARIILGGGLGGFPGQPGAPGDAGQTPPASGSGNAGSTTTTKK